MSGYQPGQICVGQKFPPDYASYNGMECCVMSVDRIHIKYCQNCRGLHQHEGHEVEWENGERFVVPPEHLKPKIDPDEWADKKVEELKRPKVIEREKETV